MTAFNDSTDSKDRRMRIGRFALSALAAGVALFAVGVLFHFAIPVVAPSISPQFGNAALFRPWSGWTSTYMILHPFGYGAMFAAGYLILRSRNGIPGGWRGGLFYGLGVFLIGSLPVFLLAFASFQVSPEVVTSWIAQSAAQYLAAGLVLGWLSKLSETSGN
jgi:hypothetical protein